MPYAISRSDIGCFLAFFSILEAGTLHHISPHLTTLLTSRNQKIETLET